MRGRPPAVAAPRPGSPGDSERPPVSRREAVLFGLLILAVYGLAFWAPFIYDDAVLIAENPDNVGPWPGLWKLLVAPFFADEAYGPVMALFDLAVFKLFGATPWPYRLASLLLHWANTLMVLALYRRLLGGKGPALWLAVLFALYPAHTEVLALATFKKHLIVTAMGLAMLHALRPWRPEPPTQARQLWAVLALAVALWTKESAFILPALCLLPSLVLAQDWRPRLKRDAALYAAMLLLCVLYSVLRALYIPRNSGHVLGASWAIHLLTSLKCLLWYLKELLAPWQLCQEHSLLRVGAVFSAETAALLLGGAGLLALGAALWRRNRLAFLAFAACLMSLAPFLNLIPFLNVSLVANRYLYFASAWLFLLLGLALRGAWGLRLASLPALPLLFSAVGLAYAGLGMRNLSLYIDPFELWSRAAACAPANPRAQGILGNAYSDRLLFDEAGQTLTRATGFVSAGCKFGPALTLDLALNQAMKGDAVKCARVAEAVARQEPSWVAFRILGMCRLKTGDNERAAAALRQALKFSPYDGLSRAHLGLYHYRAGRFKAAEAMWTSALLMSESRTMTFKYLGGLYRRQGRLAKARWAYESSLEGNPLQFDAIEALADIYARAGHQGRALRLYDRLVADIQEAEDGTRRFPDRFTPAEARLARRSLATAIRQRARFRDRLAARGKAARPAPPDRA